MPDPGHSPDRRTRQISTRVAGDFYRRLLRLTMADGTTPTALSRKLLSAWVQQEEQKRPPDRLPFA